MENSLQEIAGSFTFLAMKSKWIATLALALLPTALVVPQSSASTPHCVGENCEISFTYTGSGQTWSPPSGIKNLRFEIYGAAGGRGGAGGKVTGTFTTTPETLHIFIGEAGGMGSGIDGGFNGGGASGGNSGTEGAGGGASDIRLSETLESRIVVAGGGGGGGGEAGGNGGHGGQEFAAHGGSGQASGGGGATQTEGGFAGVSNGGFQAATPGQLGLGGSGGFSTFAGGGGGGGGYYGGGGGGADDNTCCSDGGGGGGGSSFVNTDYVTDIAHQQGVSWGHGWVTFRYTLVPTVTYFDLIQVSSERAIFSVEATENLVGLEIEDFELSGDGCELSDLTVTHAIASGEITNCLDGEVSLTLKAESFGAGTQGPATPETVTMPFDRSAPSFEFLSELRATSQSAVAIDYQVSDQLSLTIEQFSVLGCDEFWLSQDQLQLSSCSEGVVAVALLPNTLRDIWQNSGPDHPVTFSFVVDQTAPLATWSEVVIAGSGPFSYTAELMFSEAVSISNMALAFASTEQCESGSEVQSDRVLVATNCSHTALEWSFVGLIQDQAGNATNLSGLSVRASNPAPPPPQTAPTPIFIPVPVISEPVTPAPSLPETTEDREGSEPEATEALTQSATISESVAVAVDEETEVVAEVVQEAAPIRLSSPTAAQAEQQVPIETQVAEPSVMETVEPAPAGETQGEPETQQPPTQQLELAQPVLGDELVNEQPAFPWWSIALLLAIGALGVGAWRLSGR